MNTRAHGAQAPQRASARFMLAHPANLMALGFGSGLAPRAPGTVGTLWAWLSFVVLDRWLSEMQWAAVLALGLLIGVWACTECARRLGVADPGSIVWDEIVAFWAVLWLISPAGWVRPAAGLRAVPLLRCRQARPGGLGRPAVQARAGRSHRLGAGFRHSVRRPGRRRVYAARHGPGTPAMELKAFEAEVLALAEALRRRGWRLATAESCTGGLIAAACTAVAGSSDWFECGFVSYSNAAKTEMLGVDAALIAEHGAVSEAVARAMALGALQRARRRAGRGGDRHRRAGRRHAGQAGGHGVAGRGRPWQAGRAGSDGASGCSSTATARRCASRRCGWLCSALHAALG